LKTSPGRGDGRAGGGRFLQNIYGKISRRVLQSLVDIARERLKAKENAGESLILYD
jgi:hypothetical protein